MDFIYRYDPYQPINVKHPADGPAAIQELLDGNRRLLSFIEQMHRATEGGDQSQSVIPIDHASMGLSFLPGIVLDQRPFALMLGCSDARVPLESVFDQSFNDLFVVRIAGNVLGTECVGSFDYAIRHMGDSVKAVVVLGHTCCGAVTAAVDTYLSPVVYADIAFTHALRSLVDRVMVAVRGAASAFERQYGAEIQKHPGYREALVEASVYLNSAITAFDLQRAIAHIRNDNSIVVHYGACDIRSMAVRAMPSAGMNHEPQLQAAPDTPEEFLTLADDVVAALAAGGFMEATAGAKGH